MTELSALNVKITGDAGDLKAAVSTATGELNKVASAAGKANTATAGLSTGLANTTKSANFNAHALRGVTQQLSQVGQQTMATGNFVQALAIQLPDIGLAFGTVGTAAGLLAGIALPMVISALSGTSLSAKDVQDSVDNLSDSVSAYIKAADAAKVPTSELAAKYGELADSARAAAQATAEFELVKAIQATDAAIQNVIESMGYFQEFSRIGTGGVIDTVFRLNDTFGMTNQQVNAVSAALKALGQAGDLEAQVAAAEELMRALMDAYGSVNAMPGPLQTVYGQMAGIVAQGALLVAKTNESETAAQQLSTAMDAVIAKYSMSRTIAGQLAQATLDAAKNAATLAQMQLADKGMVYGKVGARGDPRRIEATGGAKPFVYGGPNLDAFNNPIADKKGGAGAANRLESELETLQQSLMSQEQLEMESFARRQETLNSALQQRLLSQEEHARLMEQVEKTHQFAMTKATNDGVQSTLGHLAQLFQGSKKIGAAIALANSWVAFTEVLKDPAYIGRPWARIAAAGAALSSGLNAVRSIKSAQPGSAASGGAASGGAGAAGGMAAMTPPQTSNVSLQLVGGDLFSRDQVLRLINSINEATADGARITLR